MVSIRIPSHEEIRTAYRQGEEAVISLVDQMAQNLLVLTERVQAFEDRLAKDSHISGKPPSSDILSKLELPRCYRPYCLAAQRPVSLVGNTIK
jgi:Family of unknown function (DUF6444)